MFARHFIDSLDFARNGKELSDVVPLAAMPRLQDLLASRDGEVGYTVRGMSDKDGNPVLELVIEGVCQLRCQRCLQGFDYPLKLVSRLLLVPPGELDDFAEVDAEEADRIPADRHLDVQDMIEDEILLSLPFAPKHPFGECRPAVEDSDGASQNPFAVLASLKGK